MKLGKIREERKGFWQAYEELAEDGLCDAPGGMEYKRVFGEWLALWPFVPRGEGLKEFIKWRAHAFPEEGLH